MKNAKQRYASYFVFYHHFHWYATLENKIPAETFPKFPSVLLVIDRSDRNPPITALVRPSDLLYVMLAGCDWWISIRPVDNMYDWRNFGNASFRKSRINENGGNFLRWNHKLISIKIVKVTLNINDCFIYSFRRMCRRYKNHGSFSVACFVVGWPYT